MDPSRWLRHRIGQYANLSVQERKAIRDFAMLWSFFEESWLNNAGSIPSIIDAVDHRVAAGDQLDNLTPSLLYFKQRYFPEGVESPHYPRLQVPANRDRIIREVLQPQAVPSTRPALKALLVIVYRLRNNFLHGEKWDYAFQGQLANFQHANRILMTSMDRW